MNAGQTCIAPDYLLVHKDVLDKFSEIIKQKIIEFYGEDPRTSDDYARIISQRHLSRLIDLLENTNTIHGGGYDKEDMYMAPTVISKPDLEHPVMEDEIFGPLLPILSYESENDISAIINRYPKPLSGYVFTSSRSKAEWFIENFSFGGGAVNDAIVQFVNQRLPFGGVGNSGIGSYHGKQSFETFSHHKSVVHRKFWPEFSIKYPPYEGKFDKIKKWLG
jgi:aldehyde dehydrogenase (NAD+)